VNPFSLASGAVTLPAKRRAIAALAERCRAQRALVLTYDDGPGPELTPRILDVLAGHDAHATFFALGMRAEVAPEVLDAVAAAGHEVACHTQVHHHAWRVGRAAALDDVAQGYETLARWVPADGRFRPPHGKQTLATARALRRRGAPVAWWTLDSGDTHPTLPDPAAVTARVRAAGGGVVLLHDHSRDRPAERLDYVLGTTTRLLDLARAEGLAVRPLRDLAA
jgi:peptidoglycan-N-acetylglucosamine deacetylase